MRGKIIAITNQKGGVGKTTTSINLGICVAMQNYKVLIVDFDPQGNCSSGLGIDKSKGTVYDAMSGTIPPAECIKESAVKNCYVMPANIDLTGATVELVNEKDGYFYLKKMLNQVKNDFDFVFIDCPPSLGILTLNSLAASDTVLIPIQTEFFALEGLTQLVNTINLVKKDLNQSLAIEGVVLTMLDKRTHLTDEVTKNVVGYFGKKVYKTMIPRNVRIAEAPSFGVPVVMHDKSCVGSMAYEQLAKEFVDGQK